VWFAIGEKGVIIRPPEERMGSGAYTWFGGIDTEKYINYILKSKTARGYPSLDNPEKVLHHLKTGRLLLYHGLTEIVDKARELGYFDDWPEFLRQPRGLGGKWLGGDRWTGGAGGYIKKEDTLDAWDLSRAETQRQIAESKALKIVRLIPGWENAYIARTSIRIGLRETRLLKALTMITTKDIFDPDHNRTDAIGRSAGHDPGKNNLKKAYPIPYGALVPKHLDGVLCCTRAIGAEPGVASNAHRGITPTIVVGQAAGTAAALAASNDLEPRDVDVQELRKILRENNVVLDVEAVELDSPIPEDKTKWGWRPKIVSWMEGERRVEWQYGSRIE
ncbi:MAG: FAD-dependent oxidoreductase, partial [Candidatus Bathyarchaeia archaeon]